MTEAKWAPGLHQAISRLRRTGYDVRRNVFRGFSQRGMPYSVGVGILAEQQRVDGAIIWYRLRGVEMHWMVQPLNHGYMGVQRDD